MHIATMNLKLYVNILDMIIPAISYNNKPLDGEPLAVVLSCILKSKAQLQLMLHGYTNNCLACSDFLQLIDTHQLV